jgi:hypothetical protein
MSFIKVQKEITKTPLNVSIDSDVSEELDRYVAWMLRKSKSMKKPAVVQAILSEAMKRDKEFRESQKAAPAEISRKGKVA